MNPVLSELQKISDLDSQLLESNKNQQTSGIPDVPDITFPRLKRDKVYSFESTYALGAISVGTTLETDYAFKFTLAASTNTNTFQALFDSWRIVAVTCKFVPVTSISGGVPIFTIIDYDDATALPVSTLFSYDSLKISPTGAYFERTFQPKLAIAAFAGSTFSGYAQSSSWVDCANPTVEWYGLKASVPPGPSAGTLFQVYARVLYQFKNVR